jgi:high-affinity K+ transport system ATPase subunit B
MKPKAVALWEWRIVDPALGDSFRKLDPRRMIRNRVMKVELAV